MMLFSVQGLIVGLVLGFIIGFVAASGKRDTRDDKEGRDG